jgi:hypothetical protein
MQQGFGRRDSKVANAKLDFISSVSKAVNVLTFMRLLFVSANIPSLKQKFGNASCR